MKRPLTLWMLAFWLLFLALGGLFGGISMLMDPSGVSLQMAEVLPLLPVPDFFWPGLFLFFIMGLAPLLLGYALAARPKWPWLESMFRNSRHYWAWTGTVILGGILAVWLIVQGILIGFKWPIQYVTAVVDVLILIFALSPAVRGYFGREVN